MKVYVVDQFTRDDENVEFGSGIISVFNNVEAAIKCAKAEVTKELSNYGGNSCGHLREDSPEGDLKYYCCLDTDPDNEADYAYYMVITVTEHELLSTVTED